MTVRNWQRRAGLTLIELVVVLVILSILAALVIPRIGNISGQANAATTGPVIAEVNRAVSLFENRYGKSPTGQDALLTPAGAVFSLLHPNIQKGSDINNGGPDVNKPTLYPVTLEKNQYLSLKAAGITSVHYNVAGSGNGRPSDSATSFAPLAEGSKVAGLTIPLADSTPAWTTHGSTFPDRAFNLNPFNGGATKPVQFNSSALSEFVVFGVGNQGSLRGTTLVESPVVSAAEPAKYYARIMIVYRVPAASSSETAEFPAQFVGAFAPDGSSINDNIYNFNTADKPLSQ